MKQINIGSKKVQSKKPHNDVCILCDWNLPGGDLWEKHKDYCACCDAFDWVEKDE